MKKTSSEALQTLTSQQQDLQGLTIIVGILFLLAIPDGLPNIYQNFIENVLFGSTVLLTVLFYKAKYPWKAAFFAGLAALYNPFFLVLGELNSFFFVDMFSALSCLATSLVLQKEMNFQRFKLKSISRFVDIKPLKHSKA